MRLLRLLATLLVSITAGNAAAQATTVTVTNVPIARGTVRVVNYRPEAPLNNLLILYGGNGLLTFIPANGGQPTGPVARFVAAGSSVYYIDAPADLQQSGYTIPYRNTEQHAAELAAVLQHAQGRDNLPAWVLGWSAGTVSAVNFGLRTPRSTPFGLILESSATAVAGGIQEMNLEGLQRPTLLLSHVSDTCPGTPPTNAAVVLSRISGTPARRHREFSGGSTSSDPCSANGPHGLGGLDTEFSAEVAAWQLQNASYVQALNYQGLWWRDPPASEAGWGVNITHQAEILFATWFTYDTDGTGMWLVATAERSAPQTYAGTLYRTRGPAFNAVPFDPAQVVATPVGSATFTFVDSNDGTFAYTVNGVSQTKPITKERFADPVPACVAAGAQGSPPNYQALWWGSPAGAESGWGINITQQGDIVFATWFTYDSTGKGMWVVMARGEKTAADTFRGDLFRTTGPAFNAVPFNPSATVATPVGNGAFTFTNATTGTFTYTVDGITQTKSITRQVYGSPVTVCR